MMSKLIALLICGSAALVSAQPLYEMKAPVGEKEKAVLAGELKALFLPQQNFSFNINGADLCTRVAAIPDVVPHDENYYHKLEERIAADSTDFASYNEMGNYYNEKNDKVQALQYFSKAYRLLRKERFGADSASYYSVRGIIRINLGDTNAIKDIEYALTLNPSDSVAMMFYPIFLINNRNFAKADEVCFTMLDKGTRYPYVPYIFGMMSQMLSGLMPVFDGNVKRETFRKKDYTEIINYTMLDKYAEKYASDTFMRTARLMGDVMGLVVKMLFFESDSVDIKMAFSKKELQAIARLKRTLLEAETKPVGINEYLINKALGMLYFMEHNWPETLRRLNRAIEVLPKSKMSKDFNTAELYDAMLAVNYFSHDWKAYQATLERKLQAEPLGVKSDEDHTRMAAVFLRENNLDEADKWARMAKEINEYNSFAYRVVAHIATVRGYNKTAELYAGKALKFAKTPEEQANLFIQYGIYFLMNNNAKMAHANFQNARLAMGAEGCAVCNRLETEYLILK